LLNYLVICDANGIRDSLQYVYSGDDDEAFTPCDIDDDAGPAHLHMLAVVCLFLFI